MSEELLDSSQNDANNNNNVSRPHEISNMVEIKTTEMHTAGEPLRIVDKGFPPILGSTIWDKLHYTKQYLDSYRKFLIYEPRGHYDMYGALFVEPDDPQADIAVLFMHNEGYSTMCGHAVIALGRYAIDKGYVQKLTSPETVVNIQCPCGLVKAFVSYNNGKTGVVRFHSVPAFVHSTDIKVGVPKFGVITMDLSYGGAFYAILPASRLGLDLKTTKLKDLVSAATAVTEAVKKQEKIVHPQSSSLGFLYGTILTDDLPKITKGQDITTANICVFADEEVDRSPTGSGVTARIALMAHKKQIEMNQVVRFVSSTTQSVFTGQAIEEVNVENIKGFRVEVSGHAFYTGQNTFTFEEGDTFGQGFLIH